jgi:hypothetical protein
VLKETVTSSVDLVSRMPQETLMSVLDLDPSTKPTEAIKRYTKNAVKNVLLFPFREVWHLGVGSIMLATRTSIDLALNAPIVLVKSHTNQRLKDLKESMNTAA